MTDTIKNCKQGHPAAQRRLFLYYAPRMMTVCRRYARDHAEAEDMLQEAFIKLFKSIHQFEASKGCFEGWMHTIVVNTAIGYWKKWHRYGYWQNEDFLEERTADEDIEAPLHTEEILTLIASLPPGFRLVFNLYVMDGFSHAEISAQLGITESASRSQLTRARHLLQKNMSELQNFFYENEKI